MLLIMSHPDRLFLSDPLYPGNSDFLPLTNLQESLVVQFGSLYCFSIGEIESIKVLNAIVE